VAEPAPTPPPPAPVAKPVVKTWPTITGTAVRGSTLTAKNGTWSGSNVTFTRTWLRCSTSGGSCSTISGATGTTYRLVTADVGRTIKVRFTGKNAAGSAIATSKPTAAVRSTASRSYSSRQKTKVVRVSKRGVASVPVRCSGSRTCTKRIALLVGRSTIGSARVRVPAGSARVALVRVLPTAHVAVQRRDGVGAALRVNGATERVVLARA
jgi:hypothetical protein